MRVFNYNVRTTYIDDEGIKRFTDTPNQPVETGRIKKIWRDSWSSILIYKVYDDLVDAGDVDRYLREAKQVHYDVNCTDDNNHLSGASSAMSNHSYRALNLLRLLIRILKR